MSEVDKRIEADVIRFRKNRGLKLVGECKRCGKCCEGKVKIFQTEPREQTVILLGKQEIECIHYDKEKKTCKSYQGREHAMCYMFPYLPENLYEGCGFHFEEIK